MQSKMTGYPSIDKPWLKYYTEKAIGSQPYKGTIFQHIYENNKDYPDSIALQYYGHKITYSQLFSNIDEAERAFASHGIKSGDSVSFFMTSCPELVYMILALNKIGAMVNMINPTFTAEQIRDRFNDTGADLLIVLDQLYGRLSGAAAELCVKKIVIVPIERSMPAMTRMLVHGKLKKSIPYGEDIISYNEFIQTGKKVNIQLPISQDAEIPAIMVYSSGTTGASKGIVLTNKGINSTIAHYDFSDFSYERGDKFLQIIPTWFSTGAVLCLLMPITLGITVILEPVFNAENFERDIFKYKPNMAIGANSWLHIMKVLQKKPKDLSFMKYPITGGEKLLPEIEAELMRLLRENGCKSNLITGYGMCELGSTVTTTSSQYSKPGSAGYPILWVAVAAFDVDTGMECKYGERGEIRVHTPARMQGYYKQSDATAEFFWKDSEGREWGCTGDVGYVDEDGFVFVLGRASDTIKVESGKHVYCFDIEDEILKEQDVYQCEVVGIDSGKGYENACAYIVLKAECTKDNNAVIENVRARCEQNLDKESIPVKYRVLDKFPVKASGKRDMELLKEMAKE